MRASQLEEAYSDRLTQAAQAAQSHFADQPPTRDQLLQYLISLSKSVPLGSVKPTEFARDVVKQLGNTIAVRVVRKPSGPSAAAQLNQLLPGLVMDLEAELGNSFPDGDPHDAALTLARRWRQQLEPLQPSSSLVGYQDWFFQKVWPKIESEFKRSHGVDIWGYLADLWDSMRADAHHSYSHGFTDELDPQWLGRNPYR